MQNIEGSDGLHDSYISLLLLNYFFGSDFLVHLFDILLEPRAVQFLGIRVNRFFDVNKRYLHAAP